MTLKKWKKISCIGIFLISALLYFIYDWFPNFLTSLFFPVNESIWEHNKIIVGAFFIWAIVEKAYFKKSKNIFFSESIASLICILLVLSIFTPVYLYLLKTKDNMLITFAIYLFSIFLSQIISYHLLQKNSNSKLEKGGICLFLLLIVLNMIFTYFPLKIAIFYDFAKNGYGIFYNS